MGWARGLLLESFCYHCSEVSRCWLFCRAADAQTLCSHRLFCSRPYGCKLQRCWRDLKSRVKSPAVSSAKGINLVPLSEVTGHQRACEPPPSKTSPLMGWRKRCWLELPVNVKPDNQLQTHGTLWKSSGVGLPAPWNSSLGFSPSLDVLLFDRQSGSLGGLLGTTKQTSLTITVKQSFIFN